MPVIDNVIAQLLALRFNEQAILKKANIWELADGHRTQVQVSS